MFSRGKLFLDLINAEKCVKKSSNLNEFEETKFTFRNYETACLLFTHKSINAKNEKELFNMYKKLSPEKGMLR